MNSKVLQSSSILMVLIILGHTQSLCSKETKEIVQQTFLSVVLLVTEDSYGQPLSLGSGLFVEHDIIATNFYVVEGSSGGYAKVVGQKTSYDIEGYVAIDQRMD